MKHALGMEFKVLNNLTNAGLYEMSRDCDIVHLVYEFNVFNITPQGIRNLNKSVVMTYYNTNPNFNNNDLCEACDRVVPLEKTKDTDPKYVHMPMAIPTGRIAQNEPENILERLAFHSLGKGEM